MVEVFEPIIGLLPQDPAEAFAAGVATAALVGLFIASLARTQWRRINTPPPATARALVEPVHPARVAALEADLHRARAKVQEAQAKSLQAAPPGATPQRLIQPAELAQQAWRAEFEAQRARRLGWRAHYFAARARILEDAAKHRSDKPQ
jgi:hypothetical protein